MEGNRYWIGSSTCISKRSGANKGELSDHSRFQIQTLQQAVDKLKRPRLESLNKGVNSEFDFSNVTLKQPSPGSQLEIRDSAPKTAGFR